MTPRYVPRDYQATGIAAVFGDFERVRSTLLVWATGVGKTEGYLQIVDQFLRENPTRALVIAHREELVSQPAKRWHRDHGEWPAIEMAELRAGGDDGGLYDHAPTNERLVIASVQTLNSGRRCQHCTADCQTCLGVGELTTDCGCENGCEECRGTGQRHPKCKACGGDGWVCIENECNRCFEHFARRMRKFKPEEFGLIVIDEAHHAVADTYKRLIRYFRSRNPGIKILGVTATPDRADEEALGQVFESVAHEYNLPQPILDGWLTPVEQQFVIVEGLRLANVRTTAGDLNTADLEAVMLAEEVLHKVTTPLVEIACGLKPGTIDQLIKTNRLHELPGLCVRHEPTLVHAVDVAHAERMTEIINRYLPGTALCVVGTTDKGLRRDGLKRFEAGEFQFLLSCGVFLEGTDLPNVSVIGMARPTKSRALAAQMLGRGLRALPGVVDGVDGAEERRRRIATSAKPRCLVVDFVGNAGRHKLVTSANVLGDELPDKLVERVIRKAAQANQPVDILRALMAAKAKAERERQEKVRRDAKAREREQEAAKRRAAHTRAGIVAGATYQTRGIDPFDVMDLAARREPEWQRGRKPTDAQIETLRAKFKIDLPADSTFAEASQLIGTCIARAKAGLATFPQLKYLQQSSYPNADKLSIGDATLVLDAKFRPGPFEQKVRAEIANAPDGRALDAVGMKLVLTKPVLSAERFQRLVDAGRARRRAIKGGEVLA
jgi:superfamily II DNA or RNA helicase